MSEAVAPRTGAMYGKAALAAGILAVIGFFGLGFAAGGWWFVIALVIGAVAVVLAVMARRAAETEHGERRMATIGGALGGLVVAWFVIYMIVAAIT